MAPVPPPLPGSPTVPLWFGWQHIIVALVLLIIVAVACLLIMAAGPAAHERSEWQELLDARSARHRNTAPGPHDDPAPPPSAVPAPRLPRGG